MKYAVLIAKLYDIVRYGLFMNGAEKKREFIEDSFKSGSKTYERAAIILSTWIQVHTDDEYATDYWDEKWIVLKRILVGKRKGEYFDKIVECCCAIIRWSSRIEPYEYEQWLLEWA